MGEDPAQPASVMAAIATVGQSSNANCRRLLLDFVPFRELDYFRIYAGNCLYGVSKMLPDLPYNYNTFAIRV